MAYPPEAQAAIEALERYAAACLTTPSVWKPAAAMAWRNFLEHGRGALALPWSFIGAEDGTRLFPVYTTFLEPLPGVTERVAAYDPERELLVVLVLEHLFRELGDRIGPPFRPRAGELLWPLVVASEPPPPKCHQQAAH